MLLLYCALGKVKCKASDRASFQSNLADYHSDPQTSTFLKVKFGKFNWNL